MRTKDKSSVVVHKLATILESCKSAEEKLSDYLKESDVKPDLYRELFNILNSVDDLLELVTPTKEHPEFFGAPKGVLTGGIKKIQFKHIERPPNWDFTAWFEGKVTSIKKCTKHLTECLEWDYRKVELPSDIPLTPREFVRNAILMNLNYIRAYAQTVFDETFNDKLEIIEIKNSSRE